MDDQSFNTSECHGNQVELAPPDYFSDREAYIYSVTWPTKVTMTTLLFINLDMTENKETTWTTWT